LRTPAVPETGTVTITLITGANKGLGYETARRLVDLGHTALAGARDPQRGTTAARELGAIFIRIDPTDDDSVDAAAARVRDEYGHLDVLINNAGTAAPRLGAEELTGRAVAPCERRPGVQPCRGARAAMTISVLGS
jgi:NAD(P)-dependent dehydrogenase (short-subunit alcohol dehydrogenase family)